MEKVERSKRAEESGFQQQNQREVEPWLMMHAMCGVHAHQRYDGRKHQHQRTQAINAEMILNATRRRPCGGLQHAHPAACRQMHPHVDRNRKTRQRSHQSNESRMLA